MKKNQLIMLTIIAATLICSKLIQLSGWHPSPIYCLHASWFALNVVAIWAIAAIGKIKPHEPEHSPLEYGSVFLFLLGALAFYGLSGTAIEHLAALFSPEVLPAIEESKEIHRWSEHRSILGNLSPILIAPIVEEIIFRVGVLGGLMLIMRKPWAIILSAAIFALNHADIYPAPAVAATFIFGLIAAATYLMLGLRAAIMLHFLNNTREHWRPWIVDHDHLLTGYVLISITALIVFIHQLIRHRRLVLR
ncbi:MAG TPA: type II CAAX endopeptidase family protein [Oligoflexus sp.]|uniref:CPBP family intramembrane glutamic endopeptidase n=1 Tax=Oligoflexus sp. TaxID=1971216 RepID=UPI002D61969E|nr:type II CAAX endopeptidase family protein [Oligoflexus sp.]HYX35756.1 type II CAAX endopeptidase family protein [Oligoflexus sp.]